MLCCRTACQALELMVQWAHSYTATCQDCVMADVTHHGPFYSVCQAVFYVFAFRHREIFDMNKGNILHGIKIESITYLLYARNE